MSYEKESGRWGLSNVYGIYFDYPPCNMFEIKHCNIMGFPVCIFIKYHGGAQYVGAIRDSVMVPHFGADNVPSKHGWSIWIKGCAGLLIESSYLSHILIEEDTSPPAPTRSAGSINVIKIHNCRIETLARNLVNAEVNEAIRIYLVSPRDIIIENTHFEGYKTAASGAPGTILYKPKSPAHARVSMIGITIAGTDNLVILEKPDSGNPNGITFPILQISFKTLVNVYVEVWPQETVTSRVISIYDLPYVFEDEGEVTFSGDGSTTDFVITPRLWQYSGYNKAITYAEVIPLSPDAAAAPFWIEKRTNDIVVHYTSAPPAGTDNIKLYYRVKRGAPP